MQWPVEPPDVEEVGEPDAPDYAAPGTVAVASLEDGSRWRFCDGSWQCVDPPGTDVHAMRWHHRTVPAVDLATRRAAELALDRGEPESGDQFGQLVEELVGLVDGDDVALLEAADHLGRVGLGRAVKDGSANRRELEGLHTAAEALHRAATRARQAQASDQRS